MQISDLIARLAIDADYLDRFSGESTAIAKDIRDAIAALSLPVQPVAWRYRGSFHGQKLPWQTTTEAWLADREKERGDEVEPLYLTTPPVPPTKGPEELAEIERMLNEGQGDDDGMQIMPDFDEGMSTLAKVETCLHLLEKRRDVIAAYVADENWRDDPSADERWNAGLDFGMSKLCAYLGVDPAAVTWDAATETLDGDVCAVIGNILRAKYGDDLGPLSRIATKGPEDDLRAARAAAEDIEINYVVCDPKEAREQVAAAIVDALRKDRALRSRPASALPVVGEDALTELAKHRNWELSCGEDPQIEGEMRWQVHSVNGGRNDREWTLIGTGDTPEAAIRSAIIPSVQP